MARPERNNVDYFPFLCKEGEVMQYIEHKYGNDGYATWVKILRELAVKNYHHLDLSNNRRLMMLAGKCKITEEKLVEIINDLCEMGEFDKDLWSVKVLWNQKFVDSIQDAYKKRINPCVTREGVLRIISGYDIEKKKETDKDIKKEIAKPMEHDLFPGVKTPVETFFESLINGNEIFEIARITKIPIEFIKSKVEDFRKKCRNDYKTYGDFHFHFKNWVSKAYENRSNDTAPIRTGKKLD